MNTHSDKTKRRFNIVDVLIIIGIALAIVAGFNLLTDLNKDQIYTVKYCVKVDGVNEGVYRSLTKGERAYIDGENVPVGVIEDVRNEKMKYTYFNTVADKFENGEHDSLYTLYIDIVAGCTYENGAYKTENQTISANNTINLNLPFIYESAEIISISVNNDGN